MLGSGDLGSLKINLPIYNYRLQSSEVSYGLCASFRDVVSTRAGFPIGIYEKAAPPYCKWPKYWYLFIFCRIQTPHKRYLTISEGQRHRVPG